MRSGVAQVVLISLSSSVSMSTTGPQPPTTLIWPSPRSTLPTQPLPTNRCCFSGTWSLTWTIFNGGSVNGESPLMSLKAPRYTSRVRDCASSTPTSNTLGGTNQKGRHNSLSRVKLDTRPTCSPHIDQVRKSVAQSMVMPCPLLNRKWSIRHEWSPAIGVAHSRHDELCMRRLEACLLHPCSEATAITMQLSSHCYLCRLARN